VEEIDRGKHDQQKTASDVKEDFNNTQTSVISLVIDLSRFTILHELSNELVEAADSA
jgi:hypothetical protein